jgi:hypothetical protein
MLALIGFVLAASMITRRAIAAELMVFPVLCMLIILLFFGAYFDYLWQASALLWIAGVICAIYHLIKHPPACFEILRAPSFALFIISCGGLFSLTYFGYFSSWDEFSHWGTIIKQIKAINGLYENHNLYFQDYPPAIALFSYFIQFPFPFSEGRSLFSGGLILIAAAATLSAKAGWIVSVLVYSAIYLGAFTFGKGVATVLIDYLLGIIFGATVAVYMMVSAESIKRGVILSVSAIAATVITKSAGLLFAAICAIFVIVDVLAETVVRRSRQAIGFAVLTVMLISTAVLAPQSLWMSVVQSAGYESRTDGFSFSYPLEIILSAPEARPELQQTILHGFFAAVAGDVPIILAGYGLPIILAFFLLLQMASVCLLRDRRARIRLSIGLTVLLMGLGLYLYGLLATYMTNMSEFEARQIGYFDRFVSVYMAALIPVTIAAIRSLESKGLIGYRRVVTLLLALVVALAYVAPSTAWRFPLKGAQGLNEARQQVQQRIYPLLHQIPETARIYIIWQHTHGYEYWIVRYELLPRPVNRSCWSLGTPYAENDIWTCPLTPEELRDELSTFDYLLIAHAGEGLHAQYPSIMPPLDAGSTNLYRIDAMDNDNFVLSPIAPHQDH